MALEFSGFSHHLSIYLEHWKTRKFHPTRHSREGGNPLVHHRHFRDSWTPAFAGVTMRPVVGNFGFQRQLSIIKIKGGLEASPPSGDGAAAPHGSQIEAVGMIHYFDVP